MSTAGAYRKAYDLLAQGDLPGALAFTADLMTQPDAGPGVFAARASVLKAAGRPMEALDLNQAAVRRFADNGVCWHNLASTLGDLGRAAEAETAARRAISLGVKAPETRLVLGRALQTQLRLEEAEAAFVEAVSDRPDYEEAHRDLAQLVWMRTGDARAATARLEAAIAAQPTAANLRYALALALEYTGDPAGARAVLEAGLALAPRDRRLLVFAVEVCCELGDTDAALAWARSIGSSPDDFNAQSSLAQALMAAGDAEGAVRAASLAADLNRDDQFTLALQATAWRLAGDPRYRRSYDYGRLVAAYDLFDPETSEGHEFLEALRASLMRLHGFATHPFGQSVRAGGQATLRLDGGHEPPIEHLLGRLREAVNRRAAELPAGEGPFERRNTGTASITGAWSVRLGSSGHHTNHVHPQGWLSSAFYVSLPSVVGDPDGRAGWIKFGEPALRTSPALAPEHFVQPRVGRLVLFPSYMWHGTVPFVSDEDRLTVAFDAVPA
ncbi:MULTISPECIES: putative 2OG-Fe(II) oxygenase [Phenylobacterium]|uniref:Tetratricopeptide (TPR) repeat protein n=1 Tax=Phenylobacterium koreense TaxID=266125 RepID=A0ABV2EHD0_9CAUL